MRFAILADIHSNLTAFEAVLKDIEMRGGADEVWCLGDIVGYGPEPRECIELLRRHRHLCVAGNHDWAAVGKVDTSVFNPDAAWACHWTARQLDEEESKYLATLSPTIQRGDFTLVHGSPREPIWEYLLSVQVARENLAYFGTRYCLIGHSHIPLLFECRDHGDICQLVDLPDELPLGNEKGRLIINPGGLGQPRDGNPWSSYAILDSEKGTIYHHRVAYDISVTQEKMLKLGLPSRLATRLSHGW